MKVRRYIELINGLNENVETVVAILKESGATEGEAVLALMVTRELSMDEASNHVAKSKLFIGSDAQPQRRSVM